MSARPPIRVTEAEVERAIAVTQFHRFQGTTLIVCAVTLRNGYVVTGTSACVDPTQFDDVTGRSIALDKAKGEIWALLGYAARQRYAEGR